MTTTTIPQEIIDYTIAFLPPEERYIAATAVRSSYIRNKTIPLLAACSVDSASERGDVRLLQWWLNSGLTLEYSQLSMDRASKFGHVAVLEWWRQSGLPLKFSSWATTNASENGHVAVLDWWRNSGLNMKWSCWAMLYATLNGHVPVLEWWKQSSLPLLFYVNRKSKNSHELAMKWWQNNSSLCPASVDFDVVRELQNLKSCKISVSSWD